MAAAFDLSRWFTMEIKKELENVMNSVNPNLVDKVRAYFDPIAGVKRQRARQIMALTGGGYRAGSRTRKAFNNHNVTSSQDSDADVVPDLPLMRDRSRDLIRNNAIAASAINTKQISVIGTGLVYHSEIDYNFLGLTREQAEEWQKSAEREFRLFAKCCNIERDMTFSMFQSLAYRSRKESGDVIVVRRFHKNPNEIYGTKLQMVEADRLRNEDNKIDTATLVQGIQKDADTGAAIKYHIANSHSGFYLNKDITWSVVDAWNDDAGLPNVLHLSQKLRPHQTRGVPDLAPVLESIKQLGDYKDSELRASVLNSLFTAFVKTEDGETGAVPDGEIDDSGDLEVGSGMVGYLGSNEDMVFADPTRPNSAAGDFIGLFSEEIGTAIGLPREVLMKSFKSSYSAAQAALLEAWRYFKVDRSFEVEKLCVPVLEMFLHEAVALGRLKAPGFFEDPLIRMAYCGARWVGPPKGHVDELKAVNAATKRVEAEFSTRKQESAELGNDYDRNHEQRAYEVEQEIADGTSSKRVPEPIQFEVDVSDDK